MWLNDLMPDPPSFYREDLHWHERPHWFFISALCCASGGISLGIGLLSLTKRSSLVWIAFLYVMGGLAFGGTLGPRYLAVTKHLWTTRRGMYRPMFKNRQGRSLLLELFGGWFLVTLIGWRLGQDIVAIHSIFGFPAEEAWFIGICLGVQFGLWSGVTLMWPVYLWIKNLPRRPEK
jgi:hypothetical protein